VSGRGASPAVLAELAKSEVRVAHLFEAHLDDAVVRNTDAYHDINYAGEVYIANGHFMAFGSLEETADLQITRARFTLSGVDQSLFSYLLEFAYIDRLVRVHKAFFDAQWALIVDPVLIFDGRIDTAAVEESPEDGTAQVLLTATSVWVDFERRPGRHTNDSEQQALFPGDRGFQFATIVNRQLVWGRK